VRREDALRAKTPIYRSGAWERSRRGENSIAK